MRAEEHRKQTRDLLEQVAGKLSCDPGQALAAAVQLMDEVRQLKKELTSGKAGEHSESYQFSGDGTTDKR